jgi:hypothetical protein
MIAHDRWARRLHLDVRPFRFPCERPMNRRREGFEFKSKPVFRHFTFDRVTRPAGDDQITWIEIGWVGHSASRCAMVHLEAESTRWLCSGVLRVDAPSSAAAVFARVSRCVEQKRSLKMPMEFLCTAL